MSDREKLIKIHELLCDLLQVPELRYFDANSEELLDEKIEVLEALKAGKQIKDIPGFYDVLELIPKAAVFEF